MYQYPHFREDRLAARPALIRARPLGLLVSGGPEGLMANLVPCLLVDDTASLLGTLPCHLWRANPQLSCVHRRGRLLGFDSLMCHFIAPLTTNGALSQSQRSATTNVVVFH